VNVLAQVRGVSRRFGSFTAVHPTDLAIAEGEVVGLLGANGAGKTTLIRLLLGLLEPSAGVVRLFGAAPSVAGRRRVGYLPQTLGLYLDLTVAENWRFTASAFGNVAATMPENIRAWSDQLVSDLPLGGQRQVAFGVALSHQPELLVLDEPTSGVGPLAAARLWEDIRLAAQYGAGVLVTTHNMEEAQECDRLVVMADGLVVTSGTAADIIGDHTVVEVRCGDGRDGSWRRAFALLDGNGFVVQMDGQALRAAGDDEAVRDLLRGGGIDAVVEAVTANLEEAFVAIVSARDAFRPPAA